MEAEVTRIAEALEPPPHHDLRYRRIKTNPEGDDARNILVFGIIGLGFILMILAVALALLAFIFGLSSPEPTSSSSKPTPAQVEGSPSTPAQ